MLKMKMRLAHWLHMFRRKLAEVVMDKRDLEGNREMARIISIIADNPNLGWKFINYIQRPDVYVEWKLNDVYCEEWVN